MKTTDDGGPAFPRVLKATGEDWDDPAFGQWHVESSSGMTLRDHFAGQALAGILASGHQEAHHNADKAADWAFEYADAMLAARTPDTP